MHWSTSMPRSTRIRIPIEFLPYTRPIDCTYADGGRARPPSACIHSCRISTAYKNCAAIANMQRAAGDRGQASEGPCIRSRLDDEGANSERMHRVVSTVTTLAHDGRAVDGLPYPCGGP